MIINFKLYHIFLSLSKKSVGKFLDEEFLVCIATIGAHALGDFSEAVAVMLFYQTGEFFQGYAVGKS